MRRMIFDPDAKVQPLPVVARRYCVPAKWLLAQVKRGEIPGLQAGSTVLLVPEIVERILAERAAHPYKET
jgi:hypothetical protein